MYGHLPLFDSVDMTGWLWFIPFIPVFFAQDWLNRSFAEKHFPKVPNKFGVPIKSARRHLFEITVNTTVQTVSTEVAAVFFAHSVVIHSHSLAFLLWLLMAGWTAAVEFSFDTWWPLRPERPH
jgi:hypothetical protein